MKRMFLFLFLGLFLISFTSASLDDGIAPYFKFDGDVLDAVGLYNGTNQGTTNTSGVVNSARDFSGTNQYIRVSGFDTTIDAYSICFWMNWDDMGTSNTQIITEDKDATGKMLIHTGGVSVNNLRFNMDAGDAAGSWDLAGVILSGWNHYCYTFDGINNVTFFRNGIFNNTATYAWPNTFVDDFNIGIRGTSTLDFDGKIDELGIWNKTLTNEEIAQLAAANVTKDQYPFDEGEIIINLISPENNTIIDNTAINFTANMTSGLGNFTNATYYIWYDNGTIFNQTTVTLPNTNDTSNTLLIEDFDFNNYKWNVYACSVNNNCTFADNNFTFLVSPFSVDDTTYNETVYETSSQSFIINISAISIVNSVTGLFWYNGSSYTAVITNPDNGKYVARSTLDIPLQNSIGNKSFHWQFDFTITGESDTQQNTSEYSHVVNRTYIEICNATYPSGIINFTTRNSENPFPKINATFKSAWEWYLGTGSVVRNMSYEDVNEDLSDFDFCGSVDNISYIFNVDIETDATNFAKNFYYFTDATKISGSETNTDLYLLNDSLATPTTLLVRDRYQRIIEDVLIYVQLYDVGTDSFYTVTMGKTNQNGEDIVYLNWYDSLYKFLLIQNGTTVKETDSYKVGESPQIFQIEEDIVYDLDKFSDFEYSLTFNNLTNNFVLTYIKPNGLVESGCLRVINRNSTTDAEICEVCSTSVSATLYCDISSAGNGTFIATFYATGSLAVIEFITHEVGIGISETIFNLLDKDDAAFYTILTSIIVLGVFLINPVFGIIAIIGGLLLSSVLGFALISYITFLFITCVGGVIIWILKR